MATKRSQSAVAEKFEKVFGEGKGRVDWGAAPSELVGKLVTLVCNAGGAVSFGITGNGSAYTLYFLHDDIPKDKRRYVLRDEESIEEDLRYWIAFWED